MVSVVIPAFNEEKLIGKCLECLAVQQTKEAFEVILVNNNSTDNTQKIAESYKEKMNLHIVPEKTKGRGAARRAGFAIAKGDIILSTDADTFVPPDWIEKMVTELRNSNADALAATGKLVGGSFITKRLFLIGQALFLKVSRLVYGFYWLSGFNFGIYKTAYEKTTGFDPNINANEDLLLTKKIHAIGKIAFTDNVPVSVSGRRYEEGFSKAAWVYVSIFIIQFLLKKSSSTLSDIR